MIIIYISTNKRCDLESICITAVSTQPIWNIAKPYINEWWGSASKALNLRVYSVNGGYQGLQ